MVHVFLCVQEILLGYFGPSCRSFPIRPRMLSRFSLLVPILSLVMKIYDIHRPFARINFGETSSMLCRRFPDQMPYTSAEHLSLDQDLISVSIFPQTGRESQSFAWTA